MMLGRRGFLKAIGAGVLGMALAIKSPDHSPLTHVVSDVLRWPDAFRKGDVFTIEGVNVLSPLTYIDTGRQAMFVVTEDVVAGEPVDLDTVFPRLYTAGAFSNVSAEPTPDSKIQPVMIVAKNPWYASPSVYSHTVTG